jgi:hypothetical protein
MAGEAVLPVLGGDKSFSVPEGTKRPAVPRLKRGLRFPDEYR